MKPDVCVGCSRSIQKDVMFRAEAQTGLKNCSRTCRKKRGSCVDGRKRVVCHVLVEIPSDLRKEAPPHSMASRWRRVKWLRSFMIFRFVYYLKHIVFNNVVSLYGFYLSQASFLNKNSFSKWEFLVE